MEVKQIQQKIMEECLDSFFGNMENNIGSFKSSQEIVELMYSILIIFNREILVHIFTKVIDSNSRKDFMKHLFYAIKSEVNKSIKNPITIN